MFSLGRIALITTIACMCAVASFAADRLIELEGKYLNFPVANNAPPCLISLQVEHEKVREFVIHLAPEEPEYWVYLDVEAYLGKTADLIAWELAENQTEGFEAVHSADTFPGEDELYKERLRPQFHFSSKRGWNNDPNGLMYYKGEYHLFYQHNPFGWNWGNMTWGHAISTDLVHWVEQGDKLHGDEWGTMFSGSGVVDWNNTTGFKTGDEPPLIIVFTNAGNNSRWSEGKRFTQGIAYSNDRGRTWTKYKGNPVQRHVRHANRDPKVIWWEETEEWVIVLYLRDGDIAFFTSPNLKQWELRSVTESTHECPELFPLAVDGDKENTKWILYGANGKYFIGDFDGREFTKETDLIRYNYGNCFYASQTFNDIPEDDGRRIQIAWAPVELPDMPFNQMMTFPVSLSLRSTKDGLRMFAYPVKEIENAHGKKHQWKNKALEPGDNLLKSVKGNLFDINAEIELGDADEVGLDINGFPITYSVKEKRLTAGEGEEDGEFGSGEPAAVLEPVDGKISLRILVDRPSVEIYANNGRIYMPMQAVRDLDNKSLEIYAKGGSARIEELTVREIEPIWPRTASANAGETLYNGIVLPDEWPPQKDKLTRDPMPVPYLENPPAVVPIDVGRQLFVDDFLVEESTLSRTFHQPEYHKEPVITPEEDTAGMYAAPFSGGACYDPADKLFKMWYTRVEPHAICYATSKDGIHWEKPELDVEAGTNIVLRPDGFNSSAIMLDQWAKDPNERFKYFASERTEGIEGWFAGHRTSADGIHWSELKETRPRIWGDRSTAFYNPFRKVWAFSQRTEDENGWRARSYVEGPTAEEMLAEIRYNELDTVEGKSVHWAGADELDPHHTDARFAHIEPQLYTLDASPYESIMLGQFSIWQGPENDVCGDLNIQKRNDILLGFSRDGFHWDRPSRKRFIACTWDRRSWRYGNVQSCAAGPLVVGDKLYFYFSAHPAPKSRRWDTDATTGLAILRRDGFASMDAGGRRGTLTTRPVAFKGRNLFVNVDCPDGELKVEVLDEDSQVIDGFSIANAKPIAADKTLVQVNWEQDRDLAALAGKPVRFRFHLTNGSLYAFWVSPDASGASHGYVGAGGPGYTGPTDTVGRILAADLPEPEADGEVASTPFEVETPAMPDPIPDGWLTYHLAHPGPGEAVPADPNCAIYYKGKYHLHYIYDSHGPSFAHVTSDDMVHWEWQETVLTPPTRGHGMFSGTAFLTKEGKVAIIYHGADSGRNQLAFAENDALSQWTKSMVVEPRTADGKPANDPPNAMRHWDPDCWRIGDTYYALGGGENPTVASSKDLKNWLFQGELFHPDFPEDLGVPKEEDVSCPNMFKLGDKWMLLCISHGLGARYYLGDFKDGQYLPYHHALLNWAAWDLFAPETLLTPDGRRVMWAWSTPGVYVDQRVERSKNFDRLKNEKFQSGIQSLPRELSLDDDGMLEMRPLRELTQLRTQQKEVENITIKSGETRVLEDMKGDTIELEVVFVAPQASEFGLRILANAKGANGFKIASGTDRDTITLDYVEPPFRLKEGEDLTLRIFIDKGMIEVFANDRQAAVAWHDYEPGNQHVALYANGADVKVRKVTCWSMKSIY